MFVTSKSSNELQIICVHRQYLFIGLPTVPETVLIKYSMKPTGHSPSLIQRLRNSFMLQLSIQSKNLSFLQGVILCGDICRFKSMEQDFLARNRLRPLSQSGALESGVLFKGMDTVGFCAFTNVRNMRRNIHNGVNRKRL